LVGVQLDDITNFQLGPSLNFEKLLSALKASDFDRFAINLFLRLVHPQINDQIENCLGKDTNYSDYRDDERTCVLFVGHRVQNKVQCDCDLVESKKGVCQKQKLSN
jgi:hypothetical protein